MLLINNEPMYVVNLKESRRPSSREQTVLLTVMNGKTELSSYLVPSDWWHARDPEKRLTYHGNRFEHRR